MLWCKIDMLMGYLLCVGGGSFGLMWYERNRKDEIDWGEEKEESERN